MKSPRVNGTAEMPLTQHQQLWSWRDCFEEMYPDIQRLIRSTAIPYVDQSNPLLHLDELEAECRAHFAKLACEGKLDDTASRKKFFALLKVVFRNRVNTLISRHVYSKKRGGVGVSYKVTKEPRIVRLSLDDPEQNLQIAVATTDGGALNELLDCLSEKLSGNELTILRLLVKHELPRKAIRQGSGLSNIEWNAALLGLRRKAADAFRGIES